MRIIHYIDIVSIALPITRDAPQHTRVTRCLFTSTESSLCYIIETILELMNASSNNNKYCLVVKSNILKIRWFVGIIPKI